MRIETGLPGDGSIFTARRLTPPSSEEQSVGRFLNDDRQDYDPYPLIFHGDPDDTPMREWLVDEVLPKVGTALLTAQWGTYKTFTAFDLSAAVMVGGTFAGRQVQRSGAVLWIAVEGQSEVRIRLAAVAEEKIRPVIDGYLVKLDPEHLPFAWVRACPKLSDPTALPKFRAIVAKAVAEFRRRCDMPLALIIIDTLSPAAEFKDANDTAENQRVMTVLKTVAIEFETLLVAVDHMGKDTSTGTRNSSVKEADVDSVIALLGEKDLAGNVANPRFAMRKVRGAPTGWEVKFDKRVVTVGSGIQAATTLVIDWAKMSETVKPAKPEKPLWNTVGERTLKSCLERVLIEQGTEQQPYGINGPRVKAVHLSKVRSEFISEYPSDDDDPVKAADTKRKAFTRTREAAMTKGLVQTKQIGASLVDWIWLVSDSFDGVEK